MKYQKIIVDSDASQTFGTSMAPLGAANVRASGIWLDMSRCTSITTMTADCLSGDWIDSVWLPSSITTITGLSGINKNLYLSPTASAQYVFSDASAAAPCENFYFDGTLDQFIKSVSQINVEAGAPLYNARNFWVSPAAGEDYVRVTDLAIPEGKSITTIQNYLFCHGTECPSPFTSITIPSTVTGTIGKSAFKGNSNVTKLTINKNPNKFDTDAFSGLTSLSYVFLEDTSNVISVSLPDSTNIKAVVVPDDKADSYLTDTNWKNYSDRQYPASADIETILSAPQYDSEKGSTAAVVHVSVSDLVEHVTGLPEGVSQTIIVMDSYTTGSSAKWVTEIPSFSGKTVNASGITLDFSECLHIKTVASSALNNAAWCSVLKLPSSMTTIANIKGVQDRVYIKNPVSTGTARKITLGQNVADATTSPTYEVYFEGTAADWLGNITPYSTSPYTPVYMGAKLHLQNSEDPTAEIVIDDTYTNSLGQQVALDASSIGNYMFACKSADYAQFTSVVVSANATNSSKPTYLFAYQTKIETAVVKGTVAPSMFNSCTGLTSLTLLNSAMINYNSSNFPTVTQINHLYVPADLVDSYKVASNWKNIAANILPITVPINEVAGYISNLSASDSKRIAVGDVPGYTAIPDLSGVTTDVTGIVLDFSNTTVKTVAGKGITTGTWCSELKLPATMEKIGNISAVQDKVYIKNPVSTGSARKTEIGSGSANVSSTYEIYFNGTLADWCGNFTGNGENLTTYYGKKLYTQTTSGTTVTDTQVTTLTIQDTYTDSLGNVTPLTAIPDRWFAQYSTDTVSNGFTNPTVPATVTSGNDLFRNRSTFTMVTLKGNTVMSGMVSNCTGLKKLILKCEGSNAPGSFALNAIDGIPTETFTVCVSSNMVQDYKTRYSSISQLIHTDYIDAGYGDYLLKDGRLLSNDAYTAADHDSVIAMVVYPASTTYPPTVVSLTANYSSSWCTSSAEGANKSVYVTKGTDGFKTMEENLSDFDPDSANFSTLYPAWDIAKKFGSESGYPEYFSEGWFIPTYNEVTAYLLYLDDSYKVFAPTDAAYQKYTGNSNSHLVTSGTTVLSCTNSSDAQNGTPKEKILLTATCGSSYTYPLKTASMKLYLFHEL